MTLTFTVFGVPQQKGSTQSFGYIPKDSDGRPRMRRTRDGRVVPIILTTTKSDNPSVKGWQALVADGASRAIQQLPDAERGRLTEGVRVTIAFFLPRPKALMKRGVPVAHLKAPDLDKLARGILDALTKVVWGDDSQVVELVAAKQYADVDDAPHVTIRVEPTAGTRPVVVPAAPLPLLEGVL